MIDPVRQRNLYRFTLFSIPLLGAMLVFSAYDEVQRRALVTRREREQQRRVNDQAKLDEVRHRKQQKVFKCSLLV
jgi:hypothetical protein